MAIKKTLLEIVQKILSEMDGDEVNSIGDTEESAQVTRIVVSTYDNMISNGTWPHTRRAVTLSNSGDNLLPTHLTLPDNVRELVFLKYNNALITETARDYQEVEYLKPDDFLREINTRDSDQASVTIVIDPSGTELLIDNETMPRFFTSFDGETLVFDSYVLSTEATLQASNVQAVAFIQPELLLLDTAVPDLPVDAQSMLIEEATSRCQAKIRQFNDVKSEQEAGRQRRWMSGKSWRVNGGMSYPNYGKRKNGARNNLQEVQTRRG